MDLSDEHHVRMAQRCIADCASMLIFVKCCLAKVDP